MDPSDKRLAEPRKGDKKPQDQTGPTSYNGPELTLSNGTVIPNPFYEPMPRPEIWHRKARAAFPFGETPYTAQAMSNQINRDLGMSSSSTSRSSMWDLPVATPENVARANDAARWFREKEMTAARERSGFFDKLAKGKEVKIENDTKSKVKKETEEPSEDGN